MTRSLLPQQREFYGSQAVQLFPIAEPNSAGRSASGCRVLLARPHAEPGQKFAGRSDGRRAVQESDDCLLFVPSPRHLHAVSARRTRGLALRARIGSESAVVHVFFLRGP